MRPAWPSWQINRIVCPVPTQYVLVCCTHTHAAAGSLAERCQFRALQTYNGVHARRYCILRKGGGRHARPCHAGMVPHQHCCTNIFTRHTHTRTPRALTLKRGDMLIMRGWHASPRHPHHQPVWYTDHHMCAPTQCLQLHFRYCVLPPFR